MMNCPGWYPPGQMCYPPELPTYLKSVCDLKPIVGVPSDSEIIGIHAVINTANRVFGVPEMHDPGLFIKLADHLFNAQMAKYRSTYSLITFPSDSTYTPPTMPSHISVRLEPILGAPSDEEVMKVQDVLQTYQEFRRIPSMFDARINMELSQHLFDIQMGSRPTTADQTPNLIPGTGVPEPSEGSNQLAERFGVPLEHSNEPIERQPANQSDSNCLAERFNQVLERLTQLLEQTHRPEDQSHQPTERFNQLFERLDQLIEQSNQYAQKANELTESSNEIAKRTNELGEQANKPLERLGDELKNVNRVLVAIQHAIVRNHKGNTVNAIDCLVNEKGETPGVSEATSGRSFSFLSNFYSHHSDYKLPVVVDGTAQEFYMPVGWLEAFLRFYGITDGLCKDEFGLELLPGKEGEARKRLGKYLSSCLG
ncbi:hypothetical protein RSAG8_03990, partial [Rhizoctonia solani AG-8 WAC10335]